MPKGIIVVANSSQSGCTIATSAIAATFKSLKLQFKAIKPLIFGTDQQEADFLALVSKDTISYSITLLESYKSSSKKEFEKLISTCGGILQPIMLDSPCPIAQPLFGYSHNIDICDLSNNQRWPLLITTLATKTMYNNFKLAIEHAQLKNTTIIGLLATCPHDDIKLTEKEDELTQIASEYGIKPLGIIPFSPSISISDLNQGNIIKITSANVDLFPIQQALDLYIKV